MYSSKKYRFSKATFAILMVFIIWSLMSLLLKPMDVTSFWGVGLGAAAALLFVLALDLKEMGVKKGAIVFVSLAAVVCGAVWLNRFRGWPFGFLTYHDILGWKILGGVAWPIPTFWIFMTNAAFLLTRPKEMRYDVKLLFSWAFDTGLTVMLSALMVEPILAATTAQAWAMPGPVMGVPFSCFIGWFLSAFVAAFVAILASKPWLSENSPRPWLLMLAASALSLLGLAAATHQSLVPVQALCLVSTVYFAWICRKASKKHKTTDGERPLEAPPTADQPSATETPSP